MTTRAALSIDYKTIFSATASAYLILDVAFTIVEVNAAYLQATGRTQESLLGRNLFDAFPNNPNDPQANGVRKLRASLERVIQTRKSDQVGVLQYDIPVGPPGSDHFEKRYWSPINSPVLDDEGNVSLVIHHAVEITDRISADVALQRSTAELREKEEQLRLATDAAEIGLWDVDLFSDTLYWPPRVKAMFGISPDVPVTMADYYDGLHPADRPSTVAAFNAALDPVARAVYDVEYRTIGKEDRRVRWVAAKGRGVFDASGSCIRVIGTAIDVTARKADEVRLRELNEDLEKRVAAAVAEKKILADLVEGTNAFVQVADLQYRWLAINKAAADEWERIFGPRPSVGASMLELLHDKPKERAEVAAVWSRALAGEEFTIVGEFGDEERDRRHYEIRFNSLYDKDGRLFGAYQFVYDVTERIRGQQHLARAEAALQQAQKMEAVGQLTGGIAHDFNNILHAVQGSLLLIRQVPADPRVPTWAENGLQAIRKGADVTSRLLTFARQKQVEPKLIIASKVMKGMEDMLKQSIGPLIHLRFDLASVDMAVMVDPTQLEMAVLNLAINARDAMSNGGTLTVATRVCGHDQFPTLEPGDYLALEVSDTGPGMPQDVVSRAFEPFFTTKDIGKGTGLGLSQVYGMAKQAGGGAFIRSQVGRGTSVSILLPLATNTATEIDVPTLRTQNSKVPCARMWLMTTLWSEQRWWRS